MIMNLYHKFAVIFDMDGVIVDSNPTHTIALRKFFEQHGYNLTDEELKTGVYGRSNKDWLPELFGDSLTTEEYKKLADEKEALFRELFTLIIKPLKGLIYFLDVLVDNKITRAIATSAPTANVDFVLEKTGIKKYFDVILDESDIKKGKPDPEIYLKTATAIQFPPEKCIVFEDSLPGVESAKQAGCKVVGVTTTHSRDEFLGTDLVIDNFEHINVRVLERLFDDSN